MMGGVCIKEERNRGCKICTLMERGREEELKIGGGI